MSRIWITGLLIVLLATSGIGGTAWDRAGQSPVSQEDAIRNRVQQIVTWVQVVEQHQPGEFDASLILASGWSNSDLQQLRLDVQVVFRVTTGADAFYVIPYGTRNRNPLRLSQTELEVLRVVADGIMKRGGLNRFLKRGALLHTDVATLATQLVSPLEATTSATPRVIVAQIDDGEQQRLGHFAPHWEFGRNLLEAVQPKPSEDQMVRLWARGTVAFLISREMFYTAHFDWARRLFPDDAEIQFQNGCLHEVFATATAQRAARSTVLPRGHKFAISSKASELGMAEVAFRTALRIEPTFGEARLRLGRVLGLQGRHAQAVEELKRALGTVDEPMLLYYAALFLGAEQEALGNRTAARAAYERALAHYPDAQAANLALSQLIRSTGQRTEAFRMVERLVSEARDEAALEDPWWIYHQVPGRRADSMLDNVRKLVTASESR